MVDVYNDWAGPCMAMASILKKIRLEVRGLKGQSNEIYKASGLALRNPQDVCCILNLPHIFEHVPAFRRKIWIDQLTIFYNFSHFTGKR